MTDDKQVGRLVVPSLVLSRVVAQTYNLIPSLLLIEIAYTFEVPLGIAGLLSTSSAIMVVLGSVAMSYMAIRVNNRSLMLVGLGLYCCSFVGCYLSPVFLVLLLSFSVIGIARSMVDPMASSYVGRLLPQEKRTGTIGLFFAGMCAVAIAGSPFIGYMSSLWEWRTFFILFALPFSAAALVLAWFAIPTSFKESSSNSNRLTNGLRRIMVNRSALVCIVCVLFTETTWNITTAFGISFVRQSFAITAGEASILFVGMCLCAMVGSLSGGRLVNQLGRKRLAIWSTLALGAFTVIYLNLSILWASTVALFLACGASAVRYTVSESLVLEQVPDMRGTVMSLNSIALGLGSAVGTALGGYTLLSFGYGGMGAFGLLALVASLMYRFYAVDPTTKG